jgi:hypothetical protein
VTVPNLGHSVFWGDDVFSPALLTYAFRPIPTPHPPPSSLVICPTGQLTSSIPEGTNIFAVCSGNGRCMSLREVTHFQTYFAYVNYTQYGGWDADKIYGCYCEPGWEGVACDKVLPMLLMPMLHPMPMLPLLPIPMPMPMLPLSMLPLLFWCP